MTVDQQSVSVQEILWELADPDTEYFQRTFRRLRDLFPDESTEACLYYLAEKGLTPSGQEIASWLSLGNRYVKPLFDESILSLAVASKASAALCKIDLEISTKFLAAVQCYSAPHALMRPLALISALDDYTALLPWLGELAGVSDDRVRSRAAKLLYALRPDSNQIKAQLQDTSSRVRANVLEGLWKANLPAAIDLFKAALTDENPRVVGNALVGLYLQGDSSALPSIIELSQSPDAAMRAAMAWSLGYIKAERGIPPLQRLSMDASLNVRKHAHSGLVTLQREAWQRAVREQFEALRDAKTANLDPTELEELKCRYQLRSDVAFAKLRAAEESELQFAAQHPDQFERLISTP